MSEKLQDGFVGSRAMKNDNGKIVFHSNKIVGSTMDNNNQGLKPDWTSSACILAACLLA